MIKIHSQNKGFTLIETLVAIFILTLAIAGGFSTISSGLKSAYLAKNQVTAFYLAQDAFEYLRNIRDTYKLEDINNGTFSAWSDFQALIDDCTKGKPCIVDTTNSSGFGSDITGCVGICSKLKYSTGTHFYNHNTTSNDSIFTRSFYANTISDHEIAIVVSVSWKEGIGTKTFTIQNVLSDWQ